MMYMETADTAADLHDQLGNLCMGVTQLSAQMLLPTVGTTLFEQIHGRHGHQS